MTLSNPAQYISGRTVQEQMNSLIDYVDQRAAEVATDAIASDVAQVHSDAADAHTDALAAAASASQASTTLVNAVKKTGEASQSIAGDIAVAGALSGGSISSSGNVDGASIGSGATPVTAGDLTAYGNVSLDDTTLQGNLAVADPSALINLSGAGSVLVPAPTGNSEAATKKYVDDALAGYAPMVRTTGNQEIVGHKYFGVPNYGNGPNLKDAGLDITDIQSQRVHDFNLVDQNNVIVAGFRWVIQTDGTVLLQAQLRKTDGTIKFVTIGDNS